MSHITLAQQGLAAAQARNWDEAITKLSTALKTSQNPLWLIARSKALINDKRFQEALDDANLAWHTAYERNKRPLLIDAHYRRAVAYYRLGQYANADACCVYAMRLVKGFPAVEKEDPAQLKTDSNGFYKVTLSDAQEEAATDEINKKKTNELQLGNDGPANAKEWRIASTLRMQILYAMDRLPEDDPARKLTTTLKPELKELSDLGAEKKPEPSKEPTSASTTQAAAKPIVPADTPLRLGEFQNDTNMSVSIFSKGVNKEKLQVQFKPYSAHLDSVIWPNGDEKPFTLDLWGEIDTEASTYRVTPNKVELSLKKKTPGKWKQLKGEGTDAAPDAAAAEEAEKLKVLKEARKKAMDASDVPAETAPAEKEPAPSAEDKGKAPATSEEPSKPAPSYPSSSRTGPKNWDNIGEDIDSDEEKDVNVFFKKLFKGASPEQQRAMMKSFTESNGTSLSTDWNDVKDRKVETVPPEGVEAKKW
ncbi:Cochaperone protein [Fusarium torreyae]|uniref:Cochaperone protein n=1 Tax=Fusarium torreyae TaxID=1237075 RepID=A0A9W8VCV9_9HYPO|nr:Cochaperone protein [Fusarium torreyae]